MPNTDTFNQSGFDQWPAQPATPAVSTDFDFLAGLIHTCAIEFDANADGEITDEDGDREEDWQQVIGLEDVACRVVIRRPTNLQLGDRPSASLDWRVLFGMAIVADRRNRIVWMDPDTGAPRYGYLTGRVVNAHGMNHHWIADAIENPI